MPPFSESELEDIRKKKFTCSFMKGYVEVENFNLPQNYLQLKDKIDNLEINEEDVWICGFPKSGN